jgi:hypothetical protein
MSHRCHDEWFLAFLFVIASQNDSRRTYCPPEPDADLWHDDYALAASRVAEKPQTFWKSKWVWAIGAAVCVLGFALALNTSTVHYAASVPSDAVALPMRFSAFFESREWRLSVLPSYVVLDKPYRINTKWK